MKIKEESDQARGSAKDKCEGESGEGGAFCTSQWLLPGIETTGVSSTSYQLQSHFPECYARISDCRFKVQIHHMIHGSSIVVIEHLSNV